MPSAVRVSGPPPKPATRLATEAVPEIALWVYNGRAVIGIVVGNGETKPVADMRVFFGHAALLAESGESDPGTSAAFEPLLILGAPFKPLAQ